jgi:hypothetical protein
MDTRDEILTAVGRIEAKLEAGMERRPSCKVLPDRSKLRVPSPGVPPEHPKFSSEGSQCFCDFE